MMRQGTCGIGWLCLLILASAMSRADAEPGWEGRFGSDAQPEQQLEPAGDLLPLAPLERGYRMWVGSNSGEKAVMRLERVEGDEAFPYRRHTPEGRIEHLGVDGAGGVRIREVEDLEHNAITRYDPPLPLLPARLEPGEPLEFETRITIVRRDNPDRVRDRGRMTQTILYDGDQEVQSPAGRFQCRRIRTTYEARLRLAHVQRTLTDWYHPEVGLVAQKSTEEVRALLLLNLTNTERRLLLEQP